MVLLLHGDLHHLCFSRPHWQHINPGGVRHQPRPGQHQEHLHPQPRRLRHHPLLLHHPSHMSGPTPLFLASQHLSGKILLECSKELCIFYNLLLGYHVSSSGSFPGCLNVLQLILNRAHSCG